MMKAWYDGSMNTLKNLAIWAGILIGARLAIAFAFALPNIVESIPSTFETLESTAYPYAILAGEYFFIGLCMFALVVAAVGVIKLAWSFW